MFLKAFTLCKVVKCCVHIISRMATGNHMYSRDHHNADRRRLFPEVCTVYVYPNLCYDVLTLSPRSPCFYLSAVQKKSFKTLWEKEKLLLTSNFSFSHSVSFPFGELSTIFIKSKIVVCIRFEFGRV